MSKKLIWTIVAVVAVAAIVVVVFFLKPTEKNVEGKLEDLMLKLYAGIPEENLPMLVDMPIDSENVEAYLGTKEVDFHEALVREPAMTSVPHSVALVRLKDAKDADAAVEKIRSSVDPRKWICVEASNVIVKSKGNLVVLIMCDTEMTSESEALAPKLEANFDNL